MSGATIGGVIGGIVGVWTGVGWTAGWVVGSAIGGYVDPTQVFGPRLSDLRGQTSNVGGVIPRAWGTAPVPGNVIWQQPGVTEHENTDDGKGSGTEQVTYTYTRSYAVMFHLGEIAGVLQIKRNGKIVYDARDDETLQAEYTAFGLTFARALERITGQRAMNSRFLDRCTIYNGTQTQNPDPTIESYLGVGNAPSYRGRAYMVLRDDETQAGEIAQYEIVIAVCGSVEQHTSSLSEWVAAFDDASAVETVRRSHDGIDWSAEGSLPLGTWSPATNVFSASNEDSVVMYATTVAPGGPNGIFSDNQGATWSETDLSTNAAGGDLLFANGAWFAANAPYKSTNGTAFTSVQAGWDSGGNLSSLALFDGLVHGYGNGVVVRADDASGDTGSSLPLSAPNLGGTRLLGGGGFLGLVGFSGGSFGGGGSTDYRFKAASTSDPESVAWTDHGTPFADKIDPGYAPRCCAAYSASLGIWVVSFFNRIAYGPSLSSLTLSSEVFEADIFAIACDENKFLAGHAEGIHSSVDGSVWVPLTTAPQGIFGLAWVPGSSGTPIPDAPGWYVGPDGTPDGGSYETITPCATTTDGEIVAAMCELSGLTPDEYDVSQLTTTLDGYVVARETDAANVIESLRPIGMFDPAEWDGKFRGIKRGGTAVASINGDDLVARDGDPFERERSQEAELLRKATVGYLDTQAAWSPNTQTWERRVGTIDARGESVIEVTAVMGANQAATTATRKGLVSWGEPEKQKLSLPYRLSALTPTDVVNYTDEESEVTTIRFMQIEDDSGIRQIESVTNCAEAYNAIATGVAPKPPTVIDSSIRGPTKLVVMDLPIFRQGDPDELGLYAAASGYYGGWTGAQIDVSEDAGATYTTISQITLASVIGHTATSLSAWVSSENQEQQELTVYLPQAPSSVTYENLVRYSNRAAVQLDSGIWEILQYQTVTALGDNLYLLSGLIRGRYNTTPGVVSPDAVFVLLDSSVQFVRSDRDSLGKTLTIRATTYGTSSDAAQPFDFNFIDGASQTEWTVHSVTAERDSFGDITVTWIGRARLGTELSPYHSVHFAGYRVTYSDGIDSVSYDIADTLSHVGLSHEYTTAMQAADFGGAPVSLEVTISAVNQITGAGPASAGVNV